MQNIAMNFSAAVIVALGWSLAMPAPAGAQQTTTIGQRSGGSVSVDLSVLDQLGSPSNVPQLMRNGIRSLLMPNAPPPAASRFAPATPRGPSGSGASAGTRIKLKPPSGKRRAKAAPRAAAKAAQKRIKRKPVTRKAATPPAAPTIAKRPAAIAPPPPPAIRPPPPTAKAPPPTQTATLPPKRAGRGKLTQGQRFRLMFGAGKATVESDAAAQLASISKSLKGNETMRLQLLAYSGGGSQTPSQARRLSLSRALAVRSQLIKQGIRSTRIDVRALGNKSKGGPPDRVDIVVTTR